VQKKVMLSFRVATKEPALGLVDDPVGLIFTAFPDNEVQASDLAVFGGCRVQELPLRQPTGLSPEVEDRYSLLDLLVWAVIVNYPSLRESGEGGLSPGACSTYTELLEGTVIPAGLLRPFDGSRCARVDGHLASSIAVGAATCNLMNRTRKSRGAGLRILRKCSTVREKYGLNENVTVIKIVPA